VRLVGQALLALHDGHRRRVHAFGELLQQGLAIRVADGLGGDAFIDAFGFAIQVFAHRGLGGRPVLEQDEGLVFRDHCAAVRFDAAHRRAAGTELEAGLAADRIAGDGTRIRAQVEAAAGAWWQIALEVVDPVLVIGPACRSADGAIGVEGRGRLGVAELTMDSEEARPHLADALHFALR
jgi:hypothetical protein